MNEQQKILVVDDEPGIRDMLEYSLLSNGYLVDTAANGVAAVERIRTGGYHVVISDIKMPRMGGLELLEAVKKLSPDTEVILSTAYGTIGTAVEAMRRGAYDFVQKPFNLDEMLALIKKALEKNELQTLVGVYETSKAVFFSIKLEELLPVMSRLAAGILKADDSSILLSDGNGRLVMAASFGIEDERVKTAHLALGERVAGKVAQSAAPAIVNGPLSADPRFSGVPVLREIFSSLVYPLILDGRLLGVLNASRTSRREVFCAADLRGATIFCSQIAQAIHNAGLYRELDMKVRELREMQTQLVQSEKLAAVGKLAAGVAHEINNPLTGIIGFAELLLHGGGLSPQQRSDVETIVRECLRCKVIVKNLLQFSRRRQEKKELLDLKALLTLVLQLAGYELRRTGVEVRAEFPPDFPKVLGNAAQLEQVFLNLIGNARQAMEGLRYPGRLKIGAAVEGAFGVLRFEDNGCGIEPGDIGKVFDPFFTTRPAGTGLGLSISYGVIRQHGGSIRVESEPGKGAVFIVSLPLGAGAARDADGPPG